MKVHFDAVLKQIGGNGRFQVLVFILMSIAKMFPAMMATLPVFIAYKQTYSCRWQGNVSQIPGNGTVEFGQCFVFRNKTPQLRVKCSQWDFDTSLFTSTIRSRYNLVCGWDFLAELSTTLFFLGFMLGSAGYGKVSDRYGRLVGIVAAGSHLSAFGLAAAFAPNYTSFAVFRFLAGFGNGGLLACAFTMMAEVTSKKHRILYCEMVHNGFSYGSCIVATIGYFLRDCRDSQIAAAVPILIVWLYPFVLPESPRWLFSTGRLEKAMKAIKFVAKCNRRSVTADLDELVVDDCSVDLEEVKTKQAAKGSMLQLLRMRPLCLITIINWFTWFAVSVGYFAVVFTLGDIGGNIFLNLFYSAIIEIPARGIAIVIAKKWGRVPTISGCLLIGGVGCLVNAILIAFPAVKVGVLFTSVINKFWLTAAFDTIWCYSGELYPTVIRNIGVGIGSMWARIGGMVAPQVSLLFDIWLPLPLILMGALPVLACLAVIQMPETLNKEMLEDLKDMLHLVETSKRFKKGKRYQMEQEDEREFGESSQ